MGKSSLEANSPMVVNSRVESTYPALPIPDISRWSNGFRGWSILEKRSDSNSVSPKLGVLIAESGVAKKRFLSWTVAFSLPVAALAVLAIFQLLPPFVAAGFAIPFLVAMIYRFAGWYVNRDLKVEIFREGFILTTSRRVETIRWDEIDHVVESWQKVVYQGIIHVNTHKVEVHTNNGQRIELGNSLEKIEQIGRLIQLAVADALLPTYIQQLDTHTDCDFGVFKVNRFGIKHKDKFLPWQQVKSLDVMSVGQITLRVQKVDNKGRSSGWAYENGAVMKNIHLFLNLSSWFIDAVHQTVRQPTVIPEMDNGDVTMGLEITKAEARAGTQKAFYVGNSMQERELVIRIPAGVQPGTVYRFPSYGRTTTGGSTGTLSIQVQVEQLTAVEKKLQEFQILAGIIILVAGLMWLGFWSTLDLISSLMISVGIGGLGGVLIAIQHRVIGAIAGAVGAVISFILQVIYFQFMYIAFGRESFWNYEAVFVLFLSVLPGFGLYILLKKLTEKKTTER